MSKSKSYRVKSYRVTGITYDKKQFDEIRNFTQIQTQEITMGAVVCEDGIVEHIAHALVKHWNAIACSQNRGTVYSLA